MRTLVAGDLAPDLLAVLGEALSNASRHADARSRRGPPHRRRPDRAPGGRRRPRARRARPRERAAQHARARRAQGRHVAGGVGAAARAPRSPGRCRRADPSADGQRAPARRAPASPQRRGPLELAVDQRSLDVRDQEGLGPGEHREPAPPRQPDSAGSGGRGQAPYLRHAGVEDGRDRAVPRVPRQHGRQPLAQPVAARSGGAPCRTASARVLGRLRENAWVGAPTPGGAGPRAARPEPRRRRPPPRRRRLAETLCHRPSDLLGVAEHRLHDHECGGASPHASGASTARVVMGPGCGSAPLSAGGLHGRVRRVFGPAGAPPFCPAAHPRRARWSWTGHPRPREEPR